MGWVYAQQLVYTLTTLVFVALVMSTTSTTFEQVAFLAALIAYHRVMSTLAALGLTLTTRAVRDELWAHRADRLLRSLGARHTELPHVLASIDLQGGNEGLEMFAEDLEEAKAAHRVHQRVIFGLDIVLALVMVLLFLR